MSDPIAAGYTLGQNDIARALGITQPEVSVLGRAFKLSSFEGCAVTVRKGAKGREMVNYHRRAIDKFRDLVANPPSGLTREQQRALARVRERLIRRSGVSG